MAHMLAPEAFVALCSFLLEEPLRRGDVFALPNDAMKEVGQISTFASTQNCHRSSVPAWSWDQRVARVCVSAPWLTMSMPKILAAVPLGSDLMTANSTMQAFTLPLTLGVGFFVYQRLRKARLAQEMQDRKAAASAAAAANEPVDEEKQEAARLAQELQDFDAVLDRRR